MTCTIVRKSPRREAIASHGAWLLWCACVAQGCGAAEPAKPTEVAAVTGLSTPAPAPAAAAEAEDPNAPRAICYRALECSAQCYRDAANPTQSLPECEIPSSAQCTAALKAARPPGMAMTLAAVKCVLTCEPDARSRDDLSGLDPAGWAALSIEERAAWTGIAIGRDCVVGASCGEVCDGPDYPPTAPIAKRGAKAAQAAGTEAKPPTHDKP